MFVGYSRASTQVRVVDLLDELQPKYETFFSERKKVVPSEGACQDS